MQPDCLAIVPAAGSGSRMGLSYPKQYHLLAGHPLIWHTLAVLCACTRLQRVVVVLAPDDTAWAQHDWTAFGPRLQVHRVGGDSRAASVLQGLRAAQARAQDWVLVHDAARPLLPLAALERLIDTLSDDPVGGLLALPVPDTVKRADPEGRVAATEPREGLWLAQTPQMFPAALLERALNHALLHGPTDEAAAVERLGLAPRLVQGDPRNFKLTYPHDWALAEALLQATGDGC